MRPFRVPLPLALLPNDASDADAASGGRVEEADAGRPMNGPAWLASCGACERGPASADEEAELVSKPRALLLL